MHLNNKNNICLFASYFTQSKLPYYIRVYLNELKKHINKVFLISVTKLDDESMAFLNEIGIHLQVETNEGFDFGLWYKQFQMVELEKYNQVFLINDSCVLFRSLLPFMKWLENDKADVKGMTYSEAIVPHIQSYFMVLNSRATQLALKYFKEHGIKKEISDVIKTYEIGMNKFFTDNGLKLSSFVDNNDYKGEFAPYYKCIHHHLQLGIPLIKKKLLMASYRKEELPTLTRMGLNVHPEYYYQLMERQPDHVVDIAKLKTECVVQMGTMDMFIYDVKKNLIKLFRPLYKSFKK